MQIRFLKLINFRNFKTLKINFSETLNIIYGKNGMGKTNIVEAIYVLSLTKSFRTTNDKLLVHKDSNTFKIEGIVFDGSEKTYKLSLNDTGKKTRINKTSIQKLSDYISKLSVIVFSPADLRIIKSSPQDRRKSVNMQLSQISNRYLKMLGTYNKILKQRNSYLRTMYVNKNASVDYLDILTSELVDYGLEIYKERALYFSQLNDQISDYYEKITGAKDLQIKYISDFKDLEKSDLLKKYKTTENKDVIFGKTSIGIHRDDFSLAVAEDSLKDFGSEGQQKNAIIAYKLSEIDIFYKTKKSNPILILDDLFSELDNEKITNILKLINPDIQTFITTTDIRKITPKLRQKSKIIKVIDGTVEEETKWKKIIQIVIFRY